VTRPMESSSTLCIAAMILCVNASAQAPRHNSPPQSTITFYQQDGFHGRSFSTDQRVNNFNRYGFNDRANSIRVRGGRWEVCTGPRFEGRCVVLRRGDYPSLRQAGLEDRISSARPLQRGSEEWDRRRSPTSVNERPTVADNGARRDVCHYWCIARRRPSTRPASLTAFEDRT
jgi:hypothetical protein